MDNEYLNDDIQDTSAFGMTEDEKFAERAIIKVIGVGGGGCNAVNYMFHENIPLINYVTLNTDKQALNKLDVPTKMILGFEITKGLGAGNNPEVGRNCAEASVDDIKTLFDENTEMVFITAGMGGGTGTGAAPVVARLAKEAGMLTIGIVTVPFLFEGEKKILKALEGAKEMQKHVDALLVINNENLLEIYKDFDFFSCFNKADDTLANAARSISEIISEECYINVDFQDVKTTLKDSGTAIISTAYGEGDHRVSDAIHNALHSPLLKRHDIKTSKRLLFKFSTSRKGEKPLVASEINEISQFTANLPSSVDVKWGIADNPSLGEKVKVTILASGFDVTLRDTDETDGPGPIIIESSADGFDDKPAAPAVQKPHDTKAIEDIYGKNVTKGMALDRLKMRCIILTPEEFDDDEVIACIERTPTLSRDLRANEEIHAMHTTISRPRPAERNDGDTIVFG